MLFPAITAFYASLLALIYVGLAGWVIAGRVRKETLFGDGGDESMMRRVRCHANFIEYVPIVLILVGLYEGASGSPTLVRVLLVLLLVARVLHPIGMFAGVNTPRQFACRGGGIILTLIVLLVAAFALFFRVA